VPTLREFFDAPLAARLVSEGRRADVIIANNVMAHVPDLNGFVAGIATLLAEDGVLTVENPYVRDLVDTIAFDTIYHEHFCYYSCTSVEALVRRHGLWLNDVDYFPDLHGGTLRWTVSRRPGRTAAASRFLREEVERGLDDISYYESFASRVSALQRHLLALLRELRGGGARIAAYGAAAKGSTLLNAVGIGAELVDYVVDRNVHKQGRCMPGVHIPIRGPEVLVEDRPDYLLLLAWNFKDEILRQQDAYRRAGGRFIVPVPTPQVLG
jgi:hypothetical protein